MQRSPVGVRLALLRLTAPLLGAAVLGCSDTQSPLDAETCPGNLVTVSVQAPASATPRFNWTPACAVTLLRVSALAPASGVAWSIGGRMQNILPSGITYGQSPVAAEEGVAPVALQVGVTYEVRVMRAVPTEEGVGLGGGGVATFTR